MADEEAQSLVLDYTAGRLALIGGRLSPVEQARTVCIGGWGRTKQMMKTAQDRVREIAGESPLSIILAVGIAAFGVVIAFRIWRSNLHARNQFFGKWPT